ncbi:MAG: ribonuclease M5 [Desulfitobacteriia bacterium]
MKNKEEKSGLEIQELIVVEGKNDAHAVRQALGNVDVIWTEGFGLPKNKLKYIAEIAKKQGVLICTDPDFAGRQIRERLAKLIPEAGHVYVSRKDAYRGQDVGLENVSPEEIKKAFSKALAHRGQTHKKQQSENYLTVQDMLDLGLTGQAGSAEKRYALGKILGLGDTNAKQFRHRANRLAIGKDQLLQILKEIERIED